MAHFLVASIDGTARIEAQDAYDIKDDLKARGFEWSAAAGVWTLRFPGSDKARLAEINAWLKAMMAAGHKVRRG